jgi:O-antigen/teichoic acid export membrane protein
MLKKLLSHSLIYGLSPQIGTVAGVFALPLITQYLTAFDYGVWGIITAYSGGLQALATLGLSVVLHNTFFKMPKQYKWMWRQIYGFLILWSIPYALLLCALLYWVVPSDVGGNKFLLIGLVILPIVLFGPTSILGTFYYQLNQKPLPIAVRNIVFGLLTVVLQIYTISHLRLGYMGWAWSGFVVNVLLNFSYWYIVNFKLGYTPIFNFKWKSIRQALKISLPTIPHYYAYYILESSDKVMMERLKVPIAQLGEYNLASRFGNYFSAFVNAANKAIGPMMLKTYQEKNDEATKNIVFMFQIILLYLSFSYSIWSKEVFSILIKNDALKTIYPLSIIMVMAYNYRPMYIGVSNKLFYVEKTNLLWQISFVAGVLNVLLNLICIPYFGALRLLLTPPSPA